MGGGIRLVQAVANQVAEDPALDDLGRDVVKAGSAGGQIGIRSENEEELTSMATSATIRSTEWTRGG